MAVVDEMPNFLGDFFLAERLPLEGLVAGAEGAVGALVRAEVGDVERGEEDEALPVDALLDLPCGREKFAQERGVADVGQDGHLLAVQAFQLGGFCQDFLHSGRVRTAGRAQRLPDEGLVDWHAGVL